MAAAMPARTGAQGSKVMDAGWLALPHVHGELSRIKRDPMGREALPVFYGTAASARP